MRLHRGKRDAKVITLFVLLLPALLGMVSLVVDVGIMLATHRQTQSAADAAALAAARDLLAGNTGTMSATATSIAQSYSNLGAATVQVNSPPLSGNFAGKSKYVEVVVTVRLSTYFIQVLSKESSCYVSARAVAGIESVAPHELLTCLAPYSVPGLSIDGIALQVSSPIAVNSQGSGVDENNSSISYGSAPSAVTLPNGGTLSSSNLRVVGGVSSTSNISALTSAMPALTARQLPRSDPFQNLVTPTGATGVVNNSLGSVVMTLGDDDITLSPGIYTYLEIAGPGPGKVTFLPGVYVLQGGNEAGNALWIDTDGAMVANGVLFYNTGSNYNPSSGAPDASDGNVLGAETGTTFGDAHIRAAALTLNGLADNSNPLYGMIYYQRRWNTRPVHIYSGSSSTAVAGTIYARWAAVGLTLSGNWQGQVIAGSMQLNGLTANNSVSISKGTIYAKSPLVFLVE